ncbi:LamG-like jellyroll fold domain-containing protein [Kitasatospora phosalacinea]|uniref:LamG-like jellyroll fold domain-containing protein n=1 Tax=Kitasatospora phosalacinea TaxID=2065 RepID=UPI0035DCA538
MRRPLVLALVLAVAVALGTQPAWSFAGAHAPSSVAAPATPQQRGGSAGRGGLVGANATSKEGPGAGGEHRAAPGELPSAQRSVTGRGPQDSDAGRSAVAPQRVDPPAGAERDEAARLRDKARAAAGALPSPATGPGTGTPTTAQSPAAGGVEIPSARTASTSVYQNDDGSRTTRFYPRPVHFRQADGSWADIDTAVVQKRSGRWQEKANADSPDFAANAADPALVSWSLDADHKVSYGIQGASPVAASVSGSTVTYAGLAGPADVQYDAEADGVKETLVLHDASAATTWTFPLTTTGLTAEIDASGNAVFKDAAGTVRVTIPRGFMEDSAVDPRSGQGALSDGVGYRLVTAEGRPALQLTLDSAWLHDPHRVFPVRVDPTTNAQVGVGQSTYVMSQFTANYSSDSVLKVGTYDGGSHIANSYLYFPGVTSLGNEFIESAGLSMDDLWSYECKPHAVDVHRITSAWNPSSINTYPGLNVGDTLGTSSFYAGTGCSNGTQWENVDLGDAPSSPGTQLVTSWSKGGANYGLAVTASTTDSNAWKQFASVHSSYPPYLYVTYSDWASTYSLVGNVTPPTYNATGAQQVSMSNVAANWWNSTSMQLRARVFDQHGNETDGPLTGVPWQQTPVQTGQTVTVAGVIPALPPGQTYSVCWDGYVSGTTSLHDSYGVPWLCESVTSQDTAPQTDAVAPQSGTVVGTLTPQLYATGHDPDNYPGTGLDYDFQVWTSPPSGTPQLAAESGWQPNTSWAVPAGKLAWNASYTWQVKVGDHVTESQFLGPLQFSTMVQQPPITSHLGGAAGDGTGRTFDPKVGNYTTDAVDADVASVGPALRVARSYNSLDPRTSNLFGAGWSSAFDMRVQPDDDGSGAVVLTDATGRAERMGPDPQGGAQYTPAQGEYETLTAVTGGFVLLLKDGTSYEFKAPAGTGYALSTVKDAYGRAQALHYTAGRLDTITDTGSGRALHFTWTGAHVTRVATDPVTGTDPATALTWTYGYNPANADELDQVCAPPAGGNSAPACTTYSYAAGSHQRSAVLDTSPASYWRLAESSGTNAASEVIENQGKDLAHYSSSGVTLGAAGPTASGATAAAFDGQSGVAVLPQNLLDSSSYTSVSLWFRTTGQGVLFGYQTDAFPAATTGHNYTPALYVGTSGKLYGEFWQGGVSPMASTAAVNDGTWHHAVLTAAGNTQSLYLDGVAQGQPLTGQVVATGQRTESVGGGFIGGGWPDEPFHNTGDNTGHAGYFAGSISDVAFYDHALGQPAVSALRRAGTGASVELTGVALPSGKTKLAVAYDAKSDRATQVTDADGGVWKITAPTVSGSVQEYRTAVAGANPGGYWPLSDGQGTQAYNQVYVPRPTPNNGTTSGVSPGAAGPVPGSTAASFDGSTSWAEIPSSFAPVQGPGAVGLWFRTTAPGVLVGYQSFVVGAGHVPGTDKWNPVLYVGTDGKLRGEIYNSTASALTSGSAVTDGKWHFALLSADTPSTQTLYLDGAAVAGPVTGQIVPDGTAHVYIGAGTSDGGWPAHPTDPAGHFTGQIADVAMFDHGVGASTVGSLYAQATASGATAAAYDAAVVGAHPTGYWRLNDPAGNAANELVSSAALDQNLGTHHGTALGTAGPWASGTSTAASFDGTTSYVQLPGGAVPRWDIAATVSAWFRTTAPGVIYAYQTFPLGQSPATGDLTNPALYVGTDNKLHGELFGSATAPAVSTETVTDGGWHLATLTRTGTTQQLYLDGRPTGSAVTGTKAFNGTGYAYLGAGTVQGWANAPADTSGHFNGALADFSLYRYALAPATIAAQYARATTPGTTGGLTAADGYRAQVVDANARGYWRLDEPPGTATAYDETGAALPDQASGTYTATTLGDRGPSGDQIQGAATFNGTTSVLQLPATAAPVKGPNSIELWFRTSAAGVLYSYQSFPLGAAHTPGVDQWNPALYVGTDGKLYGALWTGDAANSLVTAGTVTDGAWHHAVLAGDNTGQSLYLDGAQAATSSTARQIYYNGSAYVYVGAGADENSWPNHPADASGHFTGSIAEVAFYPARLDSATVAAHFKAMGNASAPTPVTTAQVTDPAGAVLKYRFDTRTNQLISNADASGNTTSYTYDTSGFLHTVTDPDGHTTTLGHDARGNEVSRTTCRTAASCQTGYRTYLLDQANPLNPTNDKLRTASDARAQSPTDTTYTTSYTYDAAGGLTSVTTPATGDFPKGRTTYTVITAGTEQAVDANGQPVAGATVPAGLNAATSVPVDAGTVTQPGTLTAAQQIRYAYDTTGNLTRTVDPLGLTTTYRHDNLGRTTARTVTCGNCGPGGTASTSTTTYTWDGQGRPLTRTDPATTDAVTGTVHTGLTTSGYDADGDLTTRTVSDTTGGDAPRTSTWTYDTAHDLLTATTDPAGHRTTYTHDVFGRTTTTTDALGTTRSFGYSGQGWLLQTAVANYTGDPNHPTAAAPLAVEARTYDPAGRLATVTDAMGRTTHTYYNDDDTVAEVDLDGFHNANGTLRDVVLQQNTYDPAGNLTQRVTGGGRTTVVNSWDAAGRSSSTTIDPGGLDRSTRYTYDAAGRPLTTVLTDGTQTRETDSTYDPVGHVLTSTVKNSPQNATTSYTYDQRGLTLTSVTPDGNAAGATPAAYTTGYTHDALGRLTQILEPTVTAHHFDPATQADAAQQTAPVSRTGYDTFGDTVEQDDADGNITTYTYDADSEPTAVSSPAYTPPGTTATVTSTVTTTYDALGRPTASTVDPGGLNRVTAYGYDQFGNTAKVTRPAVDGSTPTTLLGHDLDGELLSETDPTGATTQYTYDDLGRTATTTRLVRQPTAAAFTTTYTHDDAGNQTSATTPGRETSTAAFNAAGETVSTTDALQHTTSYAHDLTGGVTKVTLPDRTGVTTAYDQAEQPVASVPFAHDGTALPGQQTGYDPDGNAVTSTDANGHTTSYAYDAADRMVRQTEPLSATATITTQLGYDPTGRRTLYTDGNGNPTSYTYNSLGLPESTIEPPTAIDPVLADRTYTTGYDAALEAVTSAEPGGVTITTGFDAAGNRRTETAAGTGVTTATRTFGYDADGRLLTSSAPAGTETYSYEDRGHLTSASGPTGNSTYQYDADGRLASRTDASRTTTFGYDADGRLTSTADPLTGALIGYQYDTVDDLTGVTYGSGGATRTFGYDDQHRLTSDTLKTPTGGTEASIAYAYDPAGNLTTQTTTGLTGSGSHSYGYDWAGRLTSWDNGTATTTYGYDGNGNRTRAGSTTATYDTRNRVLSSGGTTFTYTPRGTTASATTGAATTSYTYDGFDQLVATGSQNYSYDALGRLTGTGGHAFTYDGASSSITSDGTETYDRTPDGSLVSLSGSGGAVLPLTNQHGDLVATFAPTGSAVSSSTAYDPWGQSTGASGAAHDLGYQGGWTDSTTNLVGTASRWYDPATGTFTSRDTADLGSSPSVNANRYTYGSNNPLANQDPSGHSSCRGPAPDDGDDSPVRTGDGGGGGGGGGESAADRAAEYANNIAAGRMLLASEYSRNIAAGQMLLKPVTHWYVLSNGSVVWAQNQSDANRMERNLEEQQREIDRRLQEERDFEEWEREFNEERVEEYELLGELGSSSHDIDINELAGLASIIPGGSSCSLGTPPGPTAKDGLHQKPGNDKPVDNGTPADTAHNTLTPEPGTPNPGDSPGNPLHPDADPNPAALGTPSSVPALPPGSNRIALSTALKSWQRTEDYMRNMYDGKTKTFKADPEQDSVDGFPITDTGQRNVDAYAPQGNGKALAVEVKGYQRYRNKTVLIDGQEFVIQVKNYVPLGDIEHQIAKDVALRAMDPTYDPRWVFAGAGPSAEAAARLNEAGIIWIWHNPY